MTRRMMTVGAKLAGLCAAAVMVWAASAAADPRTLTDSRARIEQDIRRNLNNSYRLGPTSPVTPRIRERHLQDGTLVGPTGSSAASCSYQYGRWKRTGSPYWRDRYFECAG
jgi:hypothetical protein